MTIAEPYISSPDAEPALVRKLSDLLHELGDVPGNRVLINPAPRTASETDVVRLASGARRMLVELVNGTLVAKPMGFDEDRMGLAIAFFIMTFVFPRKLGTVSGPQGMLRMSGGNIRLPDVSFIAWTSMPGNQLPIGPVKELPPDLAVEVLSDSNTRAEMTKKRNEYFESGGKLVWEFDPIARSATAFTSATDIGMTVGEDGTLDGGSVLPGFSLSMRELFELYDQKRG